MKPFSISALIVISVCSAFGRNAPIEDTLKSADAIAYVQVVSVSEDLKDGVVTNRATLRLVGKSHALKNRAPFEVPFGVPSKSGSAGLSSDSPLFIIGHRCIVILKLDGDRYRVLRQIYVSDEGKIREPEVFRSLGFDRGAEADFAVDRLTAAMKKKEPSQSLQPTAPSGRG